MSIRQDYIDQFKVYLKMLGFEISLFNKCIEGNNITDKLAVGITHTLTSLGFKLNLENNKFTALDGNMSIYSFNKPFTNSIFFKTNGSHIYSWQIFPSKKWHNNTTMICYIMRKLMPYT